MFFLSRENRAKIGTTRQTAPFGTLPALGNRRIRTMFGLSLPEIKWGKHENPQKSGQSTFSRGICPYGLWLAAAAAGLKPLRLPRARNSLTGRAILCNRSTFSAAGSNSLLSDE